MFKKVLIANRGEIALRVIRACRELGIATVAVYSEADRESLHVRFADEDVCIGPPPAAQSYLNIPHHHRGRRDHRRRRDPSRATAFWPRTPNSPRPASACTSPSSAPPASRSAMMGDKATARRAGAGGGRADRARLAGDHRGRRRGARSSRDGIGFPVIIKADGGRRRQGHAHRARARAVRAARSSMAQNEAAAAFGNGAVYIEKYLEQPRHVEIQILGDELGQRGPPRRARLLRPAPPSEADRGEPQPGATPELRERMGEAAVALAANIGYVGAGTIEFLLDDRRQVLLHGDEHPDPGGASGHRDGHRHRPGEGADPRRGRASR